MKLPNLFNRRSDSFNGGGPITFAELAAWLGWEDTGDEDMVIMTRSRMLSIPAVWCAVDFLAGHLALMPLRVRPRDNPNAAESSDAKVEALLNEASSNVLTAYRTRRAWVEDCLIEGRGLLYIERGSGNDASPRNLFPLLWSAVRADPVPFNPKEAIKTQWGYQYLAKANGAKEPSEYSPEDIAEMVIMNSSRSYQPESPRRRMSRALGLSYFLQDYALRFFRGGGIPQVAFKSNISASNKPKVFQDFVSDLQKTMRKLQKTRSAVLPVPSEVSEVINLGFKPDDGQMADSRRFQTEEVARIYGLPPVFLQDLSKGTFANTAQQDLHLVKHTLRRWVSQMEQEFTLKLYGRDGANVVKADLKDILRGDYLMRTNANRAAMQSGALTPNEWRGDEGRPASDDPSMDKTWMPLNYAPVDVPRDAKANANNGLTATDLEDAINQNQSGSE